MEHVLRWLLRHTGMTANSLGLWWVGRGGTTHFLPWNRLFSLSLYRRPAGRTASVPARPRSGRN